MNLSDVRIEPIADPLKQLKDRQEQCLQFLLDSLKVREEHPEYAERIDTVIITVEQVMSENADQIARLEAATRLTIPATQLAQTYQVA